MTFPRAHLVAMIAEVLRRYAGWLKPRSRREREGTGATAVAEKVVAHMEASGVAWHQTPPEDPHRTP